MCGSQKSVTNVIPQMLVTLFIETGSLTWRSPIMLDFFFFFTLWSTIHKHSYLDQRKTLSFLWASAEEGFVPPMERGHWLLDMTVSGPCQQHTFNSGRHQSLHTHTQSKSQRGLSCHFCLHVFRTRFCPSLLLLVSTLFAPISSPWVSTTNTLSRANVTQFTQELEKGKG